MLTQEDPKVYVSFRHLRLMERRLTIGSMKANNRKTEQCSSQISSPPHLQPQPLLILLQLVPRRTLDLIQLSLELMFINRTSFQTSQRFLRFMFTAHDHQPSRRFREEDDHDGLYCWSDEEYCKRDLVGTFVEHCMSAKINGGASDGSDGEHHLVEAEDDSAEVSWCCFMDVELGEGEEPAD